MALSSVFVLAVASSAPPLTAIHRAIVIHIGGGRS
jgi:hypothetical protein